MLTENRTRHPPTLPRELHTPVAKAVLDPHLDHQVDHHQASMHHQVDHHRASTHHQVDHHRASMAHPVAALSLQLPRLPSSRLQLTDRF